MCPMTVKSIDENSPHVGGFTSTVGESAPLGGLSHRALHGKTRSLITHTPSMFSLLEEIPLVAAHDVALLLIAETGSGKSHLAQLIHELSPRSGERFLTVACGTLPPHLIESELLGHLRGAFKGAEEDKEGKLSAARSGTLFIDEIDVLPLEQQAKLLRLIEAGEFEPVGGGQTQLCQARLIVASNRELETLVVEGLFRKDLYYRLNALKFVLPPLRERLGDMECLTRHFAEQAAKTHGITLQRIEDDVFDALRRYDWPGNIRELENVIRRAVLFCREGVLRCADFPPPIRQASSIRTPPSDAVLGLGSLEARLERLERQIIEDVLRRNHDSRIISARELGISRVTLYNKMKKLGMFK